MIYVSSACIPSTDIEVAVRTLVNEGFNNIELSGGTEYNKNSLPLLLSLKKELKVNFLCHNYFPIPKLPFVLNLASLDKEVATLSLEHCKRAIDFSKTLQGSKYAFHAGFLLNIPLNQVGKKITNSNLFDEKLAYETFHENLETIKKYNSGKVKLYIENNVLSKDNSKEFYPYNPFFFTSKENFKKINTLDTFLPLLDVAHLKVSCNSLNLNFEKELEYFFNKTDYIHISDNNSLVDSNNGMVEGSALHKALEKVWNEKKFVTLEVYSGLKDLHETHAIVKKLNN